MSDQQQFWDDLPGEPNPMVGKHGRGPKGAKCSQCWHCTQTGKTLLGSPPGSNSECKQGEDCKHLRAGPRDWWPTQIANYRQDGMRDAEAGRFSPPYPGAWDCCDPGDVDANEWYKEGFMARRRELGDKFRWA